MKKERTITVVPALKSKIQKAEEAVGQRLRVAAYAGAEKCKTPILREIEIEMAFERICQELGIRGGQSHENLWNEMVEVVMVYPDRRLIFHMIDGREAEVII